MTKFLAVLVIALAALSASHYFVYTAGKKSIELKVMEAKGRAESDFSKKQIEVYSLDDIALRKRFCDWVRDNKLECLQANIPIIERQDDTGNDAANSNTQ